MSFWDLSDEIYKKISPNDDWDDRYIYEIFHNAKNEQCFRPIFKTSRGSHLGKDLPYLSWFIEEYGIDYYTNINFCTIEELLLFDVYYNQHKLEENIKEELSDTGVVNIKLGDDEGDVYSFCLFDDLDVYRAEDNRIVDKDSELYDEARICCEYKKSIYDEPYEPYDIVQNQYEKIAEYGSKKYKTGDLVAKKMKISDVHEGVSDGIYYDL